MVPSKVAPLLTASSSSRGLARPASFKTPPISVASDSQTGSVSAAKTKKVRFALPSFSNLCPDLVIALSPSRSADAMILRIATRIAPLTSRIESLVASRTTSLSLWGNGSPA